jgi:hypothetical protein
MEEELQTLLELIISNVRCLISNSICIHLDVNEKLEVSIGIKL